MNIRNVLRRARRFLREEAGMEALQTVCLIAIAAAIMVPAVKVGNSGKDWMNQQWGGLQKESKKGLKEQVQDAASDLAGEAFDEVEDALSDAVDDLGL